MKHGEVTPAHALGGWEVGSQLNGNPNDFGADNTVVAPVVKPQNP